MPFHAKNYFDSTMGGKDLCVFFAMAVGCNTRELTDHKDPLFLKAKAYHSEGKPDAAALKQTLGGVHQKRPSTTSNQLEDR